MQWSTCVLFAGIFICMLNFGATCPFLNGRTEELSHSRQKRAVTCDASATYRTADGTCNNLNNAYWGSAPLNLERMLVNDYDDNVESTRNTSVSGSPLPSAREVSVLAHDELDDEDFVTLMVMQWGQFIAHDISRTPMTAVTCECGSSDPDCINIYIENDEFFTRECIEVIRSVGANATDDLHMTEIRQQKNVITAYIDASMIYGSSEAGINVSRSFSGGELVEEIINGEELLPENTVTNCNASAGEHCFRSGDTRTNEQPGLAIMHILFHREHNRIARFFQANTAWSDEKIFQETRKILGAIMQRINYAEYLPLVLGPTFMHTYNLDLSSYTYDDTVKADVFNSFATAAFRFGHSQIPEAYEFVNKMDKLDFKNIFFVPSPVYNDFNDIIASLIKQKSLKADRHFAHSVQRHLFESIDGIGNSFDLPALNIQRGRDHGLPDYNEFREFCGFKAKTSLDELFSDSAAAAAIYDNIDDVDLFTGGMVESKVKGGLIGQVFGCILGMQFERLKSGDRFFYLNTEDSNTRFTDEQIDEINKVTLGKIMCLNTDLNSVQHNVFLPTCSAKNPQKYCSEWPAMNLTVWSSMDA